MKTISVIIAIIVLLAILQGFEWKKLCKSIGKPDFSIPNGKPIFQILTILSKTMAYFANACLQLTIHCFRQALRIMGIKIK